MRKLIFLCLGYLFLMALTVQAQNAIATYPFDGNANNLSSNSNNGTVNGATIAKDRFDNDSSAYLFDGATSYIDMANDASLNIKDGFSISAWVKSMGTGTYQAIVARGTIANGDYWLGLYNNGTNNVIEVRLDGEVFTGTTAVSSEWNHIVVTAHTGADRVNIYLNSELEGTFTSTQDLVGASAFNLRVGNNHDGETDYFEGEIDEVSIYDKVLTSEEIQLQFIASPLDYTITRADFGNALHFGDSTNSWINVPTEPLNALTSFSFEVWVNYRGTNELSDHPPNGIKSGNIAFISLGPGERTQLTQVNVGDFFYQIADSVTTTYELVNPIKIADSSWHHIAITVDESTTTAKYYVDGVEVSSANNFSHYFSDYFKLDAFYIGRDWTNENYFSGLMDEIRIWDYALSENEINNRKNIPLNGDESGLLYYFDFNQGDANEPNTGLTQVIDKASQQHAEMFGFELTGDQSNWVENDFNENIVSPAINKIEPVSSIAGRKVTIYGKNFHPIAIYNKVLVGNTEAEITNVSTNFIEIVVPEGTHGKQNITTITSSGVSSEIDFTRLSNENLAFSFVRNPVTTSHYGAADVRPADLNNDGYIDLVVSSNVVGEPIKIYYNNADFDLATGNYSDTPTELIDDLSFFGGSIPDHSILFTADLNGDGLLDILTSTANVPGAPGVIEWFDNAEDWKAHIAITINGTIYPADMDSDGDIDIVEVTTSTLNWYENDGNGMFSGAIEIATGQMVLFLSDNSNPMSVEDIDGDHDMDIILGSNDNFENSALSIGAQLYINEGNGVFTQRTILENIPQDYGVGSRPVIGDFDGDNQVDIIVGGGFAAPILMKNDDDHTFANNQYVFLTGDNNINRTEIIEKADIDGDGDMDLITIHETTNANEAVRWAKNEGETDGRVNFSVNYIPSNLLFAGGINNIRSADLDNDGDLEVITASSYDNQLTVYNHMLSDNDFESFSVAEEVVPSIIDKVNHTIEVVVINDAPLYRLVPNFTLSKLAKAQVGTEAQFDGLSSNDFRESVIYSVQAENGDSQDWTVYVYPLPTSPVLNDVINITKNSAQIIWSSSDYANAYLVEYSTDNFGSFDTLTVDTTFVNLDLLAAGIQYKVRVKGMNNYGLSQTYSNKVTFITIPKTPQMPVIGEIDVNSAVGNWSAVNGATSYQLDVAEDVDFNTFVGGYESRGVSSLSETLIGLKGGTTYWLRLRATNESGASSNSEVISFVTIPEAPLARDATAVTSSSFKANWDNVNGESLSYIIELANDIDFINIIDSTTISDDQFYEFKDLEDGRSHWYRLRAMNDGGISAYSNKIFVEQPLLISDLTFEEVIPISTTYTDITFSVTGGHNVYEVSVRHKGILADVWQEEVLTDNNGSYLFSTQNSYLDELGLEFEIEITDTYKTLISDTKYIYWSDIEEDIPISSFGGEEGGWQLFSIPYVLEDESIGTVFSEVASREYKKEWRLVRYENDRYLDYNEGISKIELGKGYWFNSLAPVGITINGATVNSEKSFNIKLRQGWNQIGNPYNIAISWNSVLATNSSSEGIDPILLYHPSTQMFEVGDIIEPFSGGFVWSNDVTSMDISPVANQTGGRYESNEITNADIDDHEWILHMQMQGLDGVHKIANIGMHPEADILKDKYDRTLLPRFFKYLDMYTQHDDYFYPWFTGDIVPTTTEHSWFFELESNYINGITTLEWDNEPFQNAIRQLWLIDELRGYVINMNSTDSYTFNLNEKHSFSIHYMNDDTELPVPFHMNLSDPYPNPTNDVSKIDLFLPDGQDIYNVTLEIYDLQGQKVMTVASGEYHPGVYSFETKLSTSEIVKNGVYIYKLNLNNTNMKQVFKKLIINR